jgi:hypothetical protein
MTGSIAEKEHTVLKKGGLRGFERLICARRHDKYLVALQPNYAIIR